MSTLAGLAGNWGNADGTGSDARFGLPNGVAVDTVGNVYVVDSWNLEIRMITPVGLVSTLPIRSFACFFKFDYPTGVALDSGGNLYVADTDNHTIRRITPGGEVRTLAGVESFFGNENGPALSARFYYPNGVAVDNFGNVYVADTGNYTIRKITPSGEVSTLAGLAGIMGTNDGPGSAARFSSPSGVALDSAGDVYVADTLNHTIRKITAGGLVSTVGGLAGHFGSDDGTGSTARFNLPTSIAVDSAGKVYVVDYANYKIRLGTPILLAILRQPQGQTVYEGGTVAFEVTVRSPLPFGYQWRFNGADLVDATNALLTLNNVTTNWAGDYFVVVSNAQGSSTSKVATLTVIGGLPALGIQAQPQSQTLNPGTTVTLSVSATGNPPPTYQWRRNGVNIAGAVYPTLTLSDVQPTDGGQYSVVVVNLAGAISSETAELVVTSPVLSLADNFADRVITNSLSGVGSGSNANATKETGETNHVGKAGGKSVWYAWRAPTNGTATFSTFGSGFDTLLAIYTNDLSFNPQPSILNLVPVASDDDRGGFLTSQVAFNAVAGTEYILAIDGFGGASGNIVLSWKLDTTISDLPRIIVQPLSQTVTNRAIVSFSVGVASQTPETYRWLHNCVPIPTNNPTATNATLIVSNVQPAVVGSYTLRVRNAANREVESLPAFLEIGPSKDALSQDKLADLLAVAHPGPIPQSVAGWVRPHDFPTVVAGTLGTQILNNFGSTTEAGETNHAGAIGGASRWFILHAQNVGTMQVDTIGSDIDTVLAVYTGTDLLNLTLIASDNNGAPDGIRSLVRFIATAGTDYLIAVDGVNGAQGTIQLNWALPGLRLNFGAGGGDGAAFTNGGFRLLFDGVIGQSIVIQASTNLLQWLPMFTNPGQGGPIEFLDTSAPNHRRRFYRAELRP